MIQTQDPLLEAATRLFGVDYLYPVQRYAVANTLEGLSQIVVLPTGAGKSLCFQLPSQVSGGVTVVLVPLLALLADQTRRLAARGIAVGVLRGGQTPEERDALRASLRTGAIRILYATPEVLLTPRGRAALEGVGVDCLVVDEAHCVAEWGDTFRPAYLSVGEILRALGPRSVTACTATASPRILQRIRDTVFAGREVLVYQGNPDRPNLRYHVRRVLCKEHEVEALAREARRPLVVFGRSRKTVERYARLLRRRLQDAEVRFYHAGLDPEERRAVERWFLPSRRGVLCATCAYGMGVDKSDIREVIHVDVPLSVEAYLQETGRAGRDGEVSRATLVASPEDLRFADSLRTALEKDRYGAMIRYATTLTGCRREYLLSLIGAAVEGCAGCDVCAGEARTAPPGREEVLEAIRLQRRRFTPAEAARLLCGDRGYWRIRLGLDRYAGYGLLGDWRAEDVETALEELLRCGEIVLIRRGPWKGKLDRRPRRARARAL